MSDSEDVDWSPSFRASAGTAVVFLLAGVAIDWFGRHSTWGEYIGTAAVASGVTGFITAAVRQHRRVKRR